MIQLSNLFCIFAAFSFQCGSQKPKRRCGDIYIRKALSYALSFDILKPPEPQDVGRVTDQTPTLFV